MDNILPFLADLCGRLRYTPTEAEMAELSKSSMIEMRVFFEAPALGITDPELFDKIMVFYRMRANGEKSKFKLTDPLADADRKLSKPAAPIKPVAVAAPKPVVKNEIPAAMKNAESDRRTFNKQIDVVISPGTGSFSVNVTNRMTQSVNILIDFEESEMVKLTTEAPNRLPQPLHMEGKVEANGRVILGRVVPSSLTAPVVIKYRVFTMNKPGGTPVEAVCTAGAGATTAGSAAPQSTIAAPTFAPATAPKAAAAPAPAPTPAAAAAHQTAPVESKPKAAASATVTSSSAPAPTPAQKPKVAAAEDDDDEPQTERKNLGENLDIIIDNDGNHGYIISIENSDAREYLVVLDMSSSINLLMKAKGAFVTIEGQTATFNIKPGATLAVLDMPVDNFDLQMCELRYKASIRKQ